MAVNSGTPTPFQSGLALQDGAALDTAIAQDLTSWASGLTATGTNQATALQLAANLNEFDTVASGAGCALPRATLGGYCYVFNYGANTLAIYGNPVSNDTIDTVAAATGTTLTAAHRGAQFICLKPGAWISFLMGAISS
jgi:hypothetical protein